MCGIVTVVATSGVDKGEQITAHIWPRRQSRPFRRRRRLLVLRHDDGRITYSTIGALGVLDDQSAAMTELALANPRVLVPAVVAAATRVSRAVSRRSSKRSCW